MIRLVIAVVGLIALASGVAPAREPEPEHGGKSLSAWSEALTRKDATKAERRDAAWALYMIGPKAAPALVAALGSENDEVSCSALIVLQLLGAHAAQEVAGALKSPNKHIRVRASIILTSLGPGAEPAVPVLVELLGGKDPRLQWEAMNVIHEIGPTGARAVPALGKLFLDGGPQYRNASYALREIGPAAIPALAEGLKHSRPEIRWHAGRALVFLTPRSEEAVPALATALTDFEAGGAYYEAAYALAQYGPVAKKAVPALIAALENLKAAEARPIIAKALGNIGPDAVTAVPALAKALKDPDSDLREAAAMALANLGPIAHEAAPALLDALREHKVGWLALHRMASKVPALAKILNDPNETKERRLEVAHLLSGQDPAAIPVLVAALKEQGAEGRAAAATSLANYVYDPEFPDRILPDPEDRSLFGMADVARVKRGPEKLPPQIIPALIDALEDKSSTVRMAAARALAIVGQEAKAAIPRLLKIVEERADEERAIAVVALWAVGADMKTAGPTLEELAKRESDRAGLTAMRVLTRMDPSPKRAVNLRLGHSARLTSRELIALGEHAKAALPNLVGAIHDQFLPNSLDWRADERFSATVLIHLGDRSVPELVAALKDPRPATRCAAARLLGKMRPKTKDAATALEAALRNEEFIVRATAAKALLLIDPKAARKLGLH